MFKNTHTVIIYLKTNKSITQIPNLFCLIQGSDLIPLYIKIIMIILTVKSLV